MKTTRYVSHRTLRSRPEQALRTDLLLTNAQPLTALHAGISRCNLLRFAVRIAASSSSVMREFKRNY
jgi:hypothetical protein